MISFLSFGLYNEGLSLPITIKLRLKKNNLIFVVLINTVQNKVHTPHSHLSTKYVRACNM
jgi:hypothetical protein